MHCDTSKEQPAGPQVVASWSKLQCRPSVTVATAPAKQHESTAQQRPQHAPCHSASHHGAAALILILLVPLPLLLRGWVLRKRWDGRRMCRWRCRGSCRAPHGRCWRRLAPQAALGCLGRRLAALPQRGCTTAAA